MIAGKLAFVTGAGSGIGREACRILAREGARVVAADRNIESARATVDTLHGNEHMALDIEVSQAQSINEALQSAIDKYSKPPTIVVNSAGITRDQFILKLEEEQFKEVVDVNLTGTFLVLQAAVRRMIDADVCKGASIVNVSSVGKRGNIGQANYAASKAGVVALTKTACMEFGKFGIRVNAVVPGFIETPMTQTIPENVKEMFQKGIALQRMGKPEEVAELIAFLASDRSSYVNGSSVEVTGGMF